MVHVIRWLSVLMQAAHVLRNYAFSLGSEDNITVIVVHFSMRDQYACHLFRAIDVGVVLIYGLNWKRRLVSG